MTEAVDTKAAAEPKAEPGASPAPSNGKGGDVTPEPKGAKAEAETVPLGTFKDLERQAKADRKRLAEFESKEKEAADKAAQAAGSVAETQRERDTWKQRAEKAEATMKAQVDAAAKGLGDEDKAFLALIPDDDLPRKWEAVQLLKNRKQPEPGFGTKGGGAPEKKSGLIPDEIQTRGQYALWIAKLSGVKATKEERALLTDRVKATEVSKEAKERGLA